MTASARLAPHRIQRWRRLLGRAWLALSDLHEVAAQIVSTVRVLTPLTGVGAGPTTSATSADAFGAVGLSEPPDATTLAVTILHEYRHCVMYALIDLVDLCDRDDDRLYHAPWRPDPRPLRALLNGAYAFAGVVEFWNFQRARDSGGRAAYEFARTATQVRRALDDLANAEGLTAAGRRLIAGMAAAADGWEVDAAARWPRSDTAVDPGQGPITGASSGRR